MCAMSSVRVGMSMPYTLEYRTGGAADAKNTFLAPASLAICTSSIDVVPRTMESSISSTFFPWNSLLMVFNLRRTVLRRISCPGMMNVRAM